jgi:hypothetical protein
MSMKKIEVLIPGDFMNEGVTIQNEFVADNNDSLFFREIKFPLPEGNWSIYSIIGYLRQKKIILIDYEILTERN